MQFNNDWFIGVFTVIITGLMLLGYKVCRYSVSSAFLCKEPINEMISMKSFIESTTTVK